MENRDWVNLQELSIDKAKVKEKTILTLICHNCNTSRDFTVTVSLNNFMDGLHQFIGYHSTCERCGTKIGIKLHWEENGKTD